MTMLDADKLFFVGVTPPTGDYEDLDNKPAIDGVELHSDTTKADLGLDTVFVYKGQVNTYNDLPKTGNHTGDTWNVKDTGENYCWNGTDWDCLSGSTTVYYNNGELDSSGSPITIDYTKNNIINMKVSNVENDLHLISGKIKDTSSTIQLDEIVVNKLSKTEYDNLPTIEDDELYAVDLELTGNKVLISSSLGDIVESTVTDTKLNSFISGEVKTSSTTTQLEKMVINKLTQQDYDSATKNPNELYLITDKTPQVVQNMEQSVSSSTTKYPSSYAVKNTVETKQDKLVSGTNIKTINGNSLLGSGNIVISAGGGTWGSITGTLSNQTDLQNVLDNKISKDGGNITKSDWSGDGPYTEHNITSELYTEDIPGNVCTTKFGWSIDPTDSEMFVGNLTTYEDTDSTKDNLRYIYTDIFGGTTYQLRNGLKSIYGKNGVVVHNDTSGYNYSEYKFPTKSAGTYTLATITDIPIITYTSTDFRTATTIPTTISFSVANPTVYYTNGANTTLNFSSFSCSDSNLTDGTYTWELLCSSNNNITSTTYGSSIQYVGNDKTYNPSLSFALIDNARTAHSFAVRMIKHGSSTTWMFCYNYSFKG